MTSTLQGAMTVTMKDSIEPTLMQTLEAIADSRRPVRNIAYGKSFNHVYKICSNYDFCVPKRFRSDSFEKACNIKQLKHRIKPDCAVIVATLRGLKANSSLYDLKTRQLHYQNQSSMMTKTPLSGWLENLNGSINNAK